MFLTKSESKKHTGTINPNHYGMIESIVCSKAKVFIEYPINMYENIKQKCKLFY